MRLFKINCLSIEALVTFVCENNCDRQNAMPFTREDDKQHSDRLFKSFTKRMMTTPRNKAFENFVRKGENTSNQHFLPFLTMFSIVSQTEIITLATFNVVFSYI